MTVNRKGTFKPASARSKKAALAASSSEAGQLDQERGERALEWAWGDYQNTIGCDCGEDHGPE